MKLNINVLEKWHGLCMSVLDMNPNYKSVTVPVAVYVPVPKKDQTAKEVEAIIVNGVPPPKPKYPKYLKSVQSPLRDIVVLRDTSIYGFIAQVENSCSRVGQVLKWQFRPLLTEEQKERAEIALDAQVMVCTEHLGYIVLRLPIFDGAPNQFEDNLDTFYLDLYDIFNSGNGLHYYGKSYTTSLGEGYQDLPPIDSAWLGVSSANNKYQIRVSSNKKSIITPVTGVSELAPF